MSPRLLVVPLFVALAAPAPVNAATGDIVACSFTNIDGGYSSPTVTGDLADGTLLDFDWGPTDRYMYEFSGRANCTGYVAATGTTVVADHADPDGNAYFYGSMPWHGLTCGTGWVGTGDEGPLNTWTRIDLDDASGPRVGDLEHETLFTLASTQIQQHAGATGAHSAGAMAIGHGFESTDPEYAGPVGGNWTGGGVIDMLQVARHEGSFLPQPRACFNAGTVMTLKLTGSLAIRGK